MITNHIMESTRPPAIPKRPKVSAFKEMFSEEDSHIQPRGAVESSDHDDAVSRWNRRHSGPRSVLGCQVHTYQAQIDGAESFDITGAMAEKLRKAMYNEKDETDPSSAGSDSFTEMFISSRGNEYFCEIDEDYLTDRFNLTGLNTDVQYYQYALDLVTDVFDLDCDDDMREQIEKSARHLYGLVHARYITTTRGLAKMLEKYKKNDFGRCPRVDCKSHPLLPTGMADLPHVQSVKLYCAKCEDLYNPKSSRHSTIDGAYFGTSFQNILFQVYPALIPEKSVRRYQPKVFGFKVHAAAALERWQNKRREEMQGRLKEVGLENVFVEDGVEADIEDDDEGESLEGMEVGDDVAE